jgi:RNA polymerase sigma-B factor
MEDDQQALERYARTRDPALRDELVERYRGLALYHARRFGDRGLEHEDLEQVAMIGLLNALDRFDPERGVSLSTFASRTIEGVLKRHFRDRGWAVRVPRGVRDLSVSVRRAASDLEIELGRSPRVEEIAERVSADTDAVLEALDAGGAFRTASLDAPDRSGEEREHPSLGEHDANLEQLTDSLLVRDLLAGLPERERTILELRFFDRLTQSEIGERVGISQMHVSRLLRRTLLELRERVRADAVTDGEPDPSLS